MGEVVSIVNEVTISKLERFPSVSVTLTVQFEYVPSAKVLKVIVLDPRVAVVVILEQDPP